MIYHIRYISTYLPAARLVLGTMKATLFGMAVAQPLRALSVFGRASDVPALAWPESPGFGLALGGLGLRKS